MASPRTDIQAVVMERHRMGECPVWEEATGQLVYVDIHAQTVCRWSPHSGQVQAVSLGHRVGCVALRGRKKGSYVVAAGTCLGLLDWDSQQVTWVAQLDRHRPHNRFNDGKADPAGRFVAGTMPEPSAPDVWEPAQGSLYSLQGNHSVLCLADRLGIPNGLDWSTDHRTFYHVDSLDYAVHAYDYDMQAGTISERRVHAGLTPETGRQTWGQTVGLREQITELGRTADLCTSCRGVGPCPTVCAWTAQGHCGWPVSMAVRSSKWTRRQVRDVRSHTVLGKVTVCGPVLCKVFLGMMGSPAWVFGVAASLLLSAHLGPASVQGHFLLLRGPRLCGTVRDFGGRRAEP
ncbi:regucalcin-like isoform X2 [Arvicola amphibius]|uniref:regucalcin-like isoform X2 n=1 Tax=Arvicola amphibius TaxID=1047088 RepID=UPI0018E39CBA|nr:regucalcin-like isoform X2 [Arvicola amphibius]